MTLGGGDLTQITAAAARALSDYQARPTRWRPQPHQVPPPGDWYGWLLLAGRGAGKTEACARYVVDHVNGPPCLPGPTPHWISVIAPTLGDAVTACYSGPSGIRRHDPTALLRQTAGGTVVRWPNGSQAKLFGALNPEDVERLRAGGNVCLSWLEELAAWRYLQQCWEQMRFGLRSGRRPHWVASTTPKPRPLIKRLVKQTPRDVVVTTATTDDNPHLEPSIREALYDEYGGIQLGRQELFAELLDEDKNALWTREQLDANRRVEAPDLIKITVGVDPSGGAGEQGIIVVGKHVRDVIEDGRVKKVSSGWVLADYTCCLSPGGWGRRAVQAAIDWDADDIVVETNFGGAMATATIMSAAEHLDVYNVPVRQVTASRGKRVRAEPVATLTERGEWHHVGRFDALEDQLCTWVPDEADYSPDRLDAMVWTGWHLRLVGTRVHGVGSFGSQLARTPLLRRVK